jgi:hypothetical protein
MIRLIPHQLLQRLKLRIFALQLDVKIFQIVWLRQFCLKLDQLFVTRGVRLQQLLAHRDLPYQYSQDQYLQSPHHLV